MYRIDFDNWTMRKVGEMEQMKEYKSGVAIIEDRKGNVFGMTLNDKNRVEVINSEEENEKDSTNDDW